MPLFDYVCKQCSRKFEALVMGSSMPACPDCRSEQLEKMDSVFAVGRPGGGAEPEVASPSCHTCGDPRGPGSCMN